MNFEKMNYFHIPIGAKSKIPREINAIVEIPKDTNAKYEYDIDYGILKLDRCLISSMRYPASYGFIPQTIGDDGDALDVLIYNSVPIQSLAMVEVRPIGALHMTDSGKNDYKIIGMPLYNPHNYQNLKQLDEMFLIVVEDFFRNYKNNDPKKKGTVEIISWIDASEQLDKIILQGHEEYKWKYAF